MHIEETLTKFKHPNSYVTISFPSQGLWRHMRQSAGIAVLQHAAIVRYRRPLNLFAPFKLHTKLVWFDARSLYFEHRFITLHDGFVRAVALAKVRIIMKVEIKMNTTKGECVLLPEYSTQLRCPQVDGDTFWNGAAVRMP